MSSSRPARRLALLAALALAAAGCGNKKPPTPPPRMVAAAATDLEVAQRGLELQFSLAYPIATAGGLPLSGLEAVELWRMSWPLNPPLPEAEEAAEEGEETEAPLETGEAGEETDEPPPPTSPFLFRRPPAERQARPEERVQIGPREFEALAALALRIEGAELSAAISGDRILLRLPLGGPPDEAAEEEGEGEIYAVRTVSLQGLASQSSNLVSILPRIPPPAPRSLETRPGAEGVDIVWQAEDPPFGFRVYRREAASRTYGEPIAVPQPDARSHLDRTARFDSRYVYSVTAVALEGPRVESAPASEREVDYQDRYPPEPPTGLIVLAEPSRARLLWEPSAANDLAGYLVYRREGEGDGDGFARLGEEPALDIGYLDETVASGRAYRYYVTAVDLSGNESEASETAAADIP